MKVLNFDKFMQEKNHEMIQVTVLGHEYTIKAEIPAIVPVMMARAESTHDKQLATKMVMRAADTMFGSAAVNEMCDNGISAHDLADLVQRIFSMVNGADEEESDEQELTDEDSRKATDNGKKQKK